MCFRSSSDFGHSTSSAHIFIFTAEISTDTLLYLYRILGRYGNIPYRTNETEMILQTLSNLLAANPVASLRRTVRKVQMFDKIVGYEGIKRTFLKSLNSKEPVHILLVGAPGQAKTLFLKCILKAYGSTKAYFTVGGNASKSGMIDVLFELRPKYLLIDEIEHLKPDYQTMLLSLMETGILTQTTHNKIRQTYLKTWVFATSNGTKRLSEPLLSRFRVMYVNKYDFAQLYEISTKKLLDEGLSEYAADEITKSIWEQFTKS
jgi:MoxR-like ATPase